MYLIEETQDLKDYDTIYVLGQMLSAIFMYGCGIDAISKSPRKYFEKFFELSKINTAIKKQTIRIFLNIVSNMPEVFDKMEKAASNFARDTNSVMYASLVDCLNAQDPVMTIAFLKWLNTMIWKAADEKKQAKFIAKLETQGIFDQLTKWAEEGDEGIMEQINVFTLETNRITPTLTY